MDEHTPPSPAYDNILLYNNPSPPEEIDARPLRTSVIRPYITFTLFLTFIGLLYIANTHFAEKTVRRIEALNQEAKEYKWEYTTLHAQLVFSSKESEVAKRVEPLGLKVLKTPLRRIVIEE